MTSPLLETRRLSVEIAGHRVVDQLDLTLASGERLAILGQNGAGKSTLLATLAGLRSPHEGTLYWSGQKARDLTPRQAALRRAWLGQFHADPFDSTVLETALTGRHAHLGRWTWESQRDTEIARGALKAVGLDQMEQRTVHTLSGGERQRLAIATLLTQAAPLYLLDEPLAHLDLNHQMAVLELFAGAARDCGAGVIMVLHDPGLAHRFCDHALLIYGDGRTLSGPVDEVLTANTLSSLYGYRLTQIDACGQHGQRAFIPE